MYQADSMLVPEKMDFLAAVRLAELCFQECSACLQRAQGTL